MTFPFRPVLTAQFFRCKHGHTGIEHRGCFELYKQEFYEKPIGFFDIEANGLKADFNFMYSWALKLESGTIYSACITASDFATGRYDYNLVRSLIPRLLNCSVVITYYGSRFDIPFVRTRTLYHGLKFVPYGHVLHLDLYDYVRKYLNLHSRRLAAVCDALNIKDKTPVEPRTWQNAYHSEKARIQIQNHNIHDVEVLEKVYKRLKPYFKGVSRSL